MSCGRPSRTLCAANACARTIRNPVLPFYTGIRTVDCGFVRPYQVRQHPAARLPRRSGRIEATSDVNEMLGHEIETYRGLELERSTATCPHDLTTYLPTYLLRCAAHYLPTGSKTSKRKRLSQHSCSTKSKTITATSQRERLTADAPRPYDAETLHQI